MSSPSLPPVVLSLNFPRVFVVGCPSFLQISLHNQGGSSLLEVVLSLSCPLLGLVNHVVKIGAVTSCESRLIHVDVVPQSGGSQPVRCRLEGVFERNLLCLDGTCSDFMAYERPDSPANVSFIIHDIQSNHSTGDKADFGSVKGDVTLNITDVFKDVQSVNQLLQLRLPDFFIPVHLAAIAAAERCEMLCIPDAFLRCYEPSEVLQLTPVGSEADGDATHGWRLCAGTAELALGRSSQDADVVTRFLPATVENNARSAVLSRKHALLRLDEADARITVESLSAHGLVRVGATQIRPGCPTPVSKDDVLSLGPALSDFRLRCSVRKPLLPRHFRLANLTGWIGNGATQSMAEDGNWGRVIFEHLNSAPALWQTLWFHRHIPFGTRHGAVLALDAALAEGVSGYFHHLRGCFWLECTSETPGLVQVDGHPLLDGDIVPLREGMKVRLGGIELALKNVRYK